MKRHKFYKLFAQVNYDSVAKALKKSGQSAPLKELINGNCFNLPAFFEKYGSLFGIDIFPSNTVDMLIFISEYLWATSTRTVIYPRSQSEINVISKSSFKGMDVTLTAGEMIIIASPPDTEFPPLLTGCLYRSQVDKFNTFYRSQVTLPYDALDLQSNVFVVIFQDPNTGSLLTYEVSENDIEAYANAATYQEILEFIEKAGEVPISGWLTQEEKVTQAKIIKIALNFWMYKLSSPSSFISQTPPINARDNFGSKPTSSFTLTFADRLRGSKDGTISEVGIHMRNLRDERYYTSDDWKDKPRGSRWVEVGPYTRGGKGTMLDEMEADNDI